jgi:hypothetical protein
MYIRNLLITGSVEDVPYIDVMQCIKYNWLERTIIDGVPSTIVNAVGNLQLGLLDDVEPTPDNVPVFHDSNDYYIQEAIANGNSTYCVYQLRGNGNAERVSTWFNNRGEAELALADLKAPVVADTYSEFQAGWDSAVFHYDIDENEANATLREQDSDCGSVGDDETFIETYGGFDIYQGYDGRNIEFADKLFFVYSDGCWKHTANTLDDARLWCEGKDSAPDTVSADTAPMSLTGCISSLNTLMTRDHEQMAIMIIADRTCVAFPRTYMLYKDALTVGNMVTVSGTLRGELEQLIIETVKKTGSISETDTLRQQIIELEETLATQTWIEENEILRQQLADANKRIAELSKVIQDAATELGDADVDDGHSDAAYRILQGYTS